MSSFFCLLVLLGELLILWFQKSRADRTFRRICLWCIAAALVLSGFGLFAPWMIPLMTGAVLAGSMKTESQRSCLQSLLDSFMEVLLGSLLLLDVPEISKVAMCLFLGGIFALCQLLTRRIVHFSTASRLLQPLQERKTAIQSVLCLRLLEVLMVWKPDFTPGLVPGQLLLVIWLYAVSFQTEQKRLDEKQQDLERIHALLQKEAAELARRQKETDEKLHLLKNQLLRLRSLQEAQQRKMTEEILLELQACFGQGYTENAVLDFLLAEKLPAAADKKKLPVVHVECPADLAFTPWALLFLSDTADWIFSREAPVSLEWKITEQWMSVSVLFQSGSLDSVQKGAPDAVGSDGTFDSILFERLQTISETSGGFCTWNGQNMRMMVFAPQEGTA